MKRISIKAKVTIWFTAMMLLIVVASLFFLISMGEKSVLEEANIKLTDAVNDSFDEIDYRFGKLDIDEDLDYYNDGVYLAVYDIDGKLLYGRMPSYFDRTLPFLSEQIQVVGEDENTYVYDSTREIARGYSVTVRGVWKSDGSEKAISKMIHIALIMLPLLVIIASVIGYWLTMRTFKPVKQIADAAENINNGNDLTKRIGLNNGKDEVHKLASEFDMMLDRLQSSFENEKRFTSDVSHELRTPIAVILTESESLLENDEIQSEARESIENIHNKAESMTELISSLLTLARADRGHLKIRTDDIDFSELTKAVAEQVEEMAIVKHIKVSADIQDCLFVQGDETMLIRMLLNICENGIKYGKQNGKLNISLTADNGFAKCVIEDDGIGISEEDTKMIWERFYRVDEARTSGSGLGLPLAKYICNAHNGDITLESVLNNGSRFIITLPLKK